MWSDRHLDALEQSRYGHSQLDRPICKRCRNPIRDDNWRRDSLGYVCSHCDKRERAEVRRGDDA